MKVSALYSSCANRLKHQPPGHWPPGSLPVLGPLVAGKQHEGGGAVLYISGPLCARVNHATQLVGNTETATLLARGVVMGLLGAAVVLTELAHVAMQGGAVRAPRWKVVSAADRSRQKE